MKKILSLLLFLSMLLSLAACGEAPAAPAETAAPGENEVLSVERAVDVDLTKLSSTMVYSEIYAMVYEPESYLGKTVKMTGGCSVYESLGRQYYSCFVADAAACCAQGLEFELADSYGPEEYPEAGEEITIIGTFSTYEEEYNGNTYLYLILKDAELA